MSYADSESQSDGYEDYSPSESERPLIRQSSSTATRRAGRPAPQTSARPIRLNTAAKPSGLRNQVLNEDDSDDPNSPLNAPSARTSLTRTSKIQRKPIIDADSDESEEDEMEMDDDELLDTEGDLESNSDVDMSEATPQAVMPAPQTRIKLTTGGARKPSPPRILKLNPKVQSVEAKEIQMDAEGDPDDEEISNEDESVVDDDDDEDDMSDDGGPADADALDTIRASAIGDEELGSESDMGDSRDGTPDPNKQTRRQRAENGALLALSNEAQKKKFFTQEQVVMRKTEMARRRKDLSEKRNEQEKLDTLDRLLHKRAPVRRTRAQMMADAEREEFGTPGGEDGDVVRAKAGFVRTIVGYEGSRVGVPDEWLGKEVGRAFDGAKKQDAGLRIVSGSRMVQVVE